MDFTIRHYEASDKQGVLAVFDANCPTFFAHEERQYLESYLDNEIEIYAVIEVDGKIVGSGGVNTESTEDGKKGVISWGMIHPDFQGMKLGRKLLEWRIAQLKSIPAVTTIVVRTSQLVAAFYAKNGFVLKRVEADFWAPGFDLYDMELGIER